MSSATRRRSGALDADLPRGDACGLVATTAPATGTMLGRYQVLKPLAKGGMAEVLLARAIGLGGFARHVVIKRIRVEHGSDAKSIDMFLDEARLVAALHHRNIVQVHDVGEEDGKYFFVMEYVHGRDTRELLRHVKDKKQHIPLEHVITIVTAAAAGLHYAHEQRGPDRKPLNIVHRDISPGNILLGFDGGVKVVDFGIAKTEARSQDTQAGEMKGKVGYMSPEQCRTQPLDRRTDVFLLGIVLWELCALRRLFKFDSRFETMAAIVEGDTPLPTKYRKDIPEDLERIVLKTLAKNPDDRYQTADELRLVLEAFASRSGLSISAARLSDYLKDQFGEVPEPWHVGDEVPPPSAEILERIRSSSQLIPVARPSQPAIAQPAIAQPAIAKPADTKSTQPELEALKAAKPVIKGEPAPPEELEEPDEVGVVYPMAPGSGRRAGSWLVGGLVVALLGGAAAFYLLVLRPELASKDTAPQPVAAPAALDAAVIPVVVDEPRDADIEPTAEPVVEADPDTIEAVVVDARAPVETIDAATGPVTVKRDKSVRPRPIRRQNPRPKPHDDTDKPPPDLDSPFPD
ncbi:MAG TPA: protein kinase [Kofleriaceae bacterium]